MVHTDGQFSAAVERIVGAIEARTDAELVVVAAPHSGSYADLSVAAGALSGVAALAFLCWSPIVFDPLWFPVDVLGVGALVAWASRRSPGFLVRMAGSARQLRQVREAALATFSEENVHATVGRTGVLVYVSAAEGRVELIPDQGLLGRIPGSAWNALNLRADTLDALLASLERLGALLAANVPPTGDNPDEIPNTPRVRA